MTDLPRYYIERIDAGRSTFSVDWYESTDGDWVKWGDVSARLQQLEEEKATLQAEKAFAETANEQFADVLRKEYDARKKAEAALAETREALHQLQEKYEEILARVGPSVPCVDGQELPRSE